MLFKKEVSMTSKYSNHRPQTNPSHCEEETQNTDYLNAVKAKEPFSSSSVRWLLN